MNKQNSESAAQPIVKAIVYFNKQIFKFKFPADKKVFHIEQFLKRKVQLKPVQSIFLFDKHRKTLLQSSSKLSDIVQRQSYNTSKNGQADCEIVMRLTETY